jgi:hypothetical protein
MEHIYQLFDAFTVAFFASMALIAIGIVLAVIAAVSVLVLAIFHLVLATIDKLAGPWFRREHMRHGFWGWTNWVVVIFSAIWAANMIVTPTTERWLNQDQTSMLILDSMMLIVMAFGVAMFFGHRQGWLRH